MRRIRPVLMVLFAGALVSVPRGASAAPDTLARYRDEAMCTKVSLAILLREPTDAP